MKMMTGDAKAEIGFLSARQIPGRLGLMLLYAAAFMLIFLMPADAKDIELRGMLRSYTGVRLNEDGADIPVNEQTVDLSLEGWGDMTQITINPYGYVGADPSDGIDLGVREAYIDFFFPSMDLRVGKQAVVWGEAEGAFITDIVSPQDMRSFILADFREIRMGIPAVRADYYEGPFTFEAVWVPTFTPTQPPAADSIWAVQPDLSQAPLPVSDDLEFIEEGVDKDLENSEIFGKISYFGSEINAEVMAGWAWDDLPLITGIDTSDQKINTIYQGYERFGVFGGSLSTTFGSTVFRSEAAAYLNKSFTVEEAADQVGADQYNQLHALAGLDWSIGGITMSSQYIFQYIHDYDTEIMMAEEFDNTLTFMVQDSYLSDTLTAKLFSYLGMGAFDSFDALLRPSLTWKFEDGVNIETGAEIFIGDDDGNFGQYKDNSLVYAAVSWYF